MHPTKPVLRRLGLWEPNVLSHRTRPKPLLQCGDRTNSTLRIRQKLTHNFINIFMIFAQNWTRVFLRTVSISSAASLSGNFSEEEERMEWKDIMISLTRVALLALVVRTLATRSAARRRREARDRELDRLRRFGS